MHRSLGGCSGCLGGKTAISSAVDKQLAVAAPHLQRKPVRSKRELRPAIHTSTKLVTSADGHNQPEACSAACCRDESTQRIFKKTLQVCRVLAAAMAASLALQTAPALSTEAPR